jgi:hypothetical protein
MEVEILEQLQSALVIEANNNYTIIDLKMAL